MRQHVISEWLLRRFARDTPGGLTLAVFDKTTAVIRDAPPSRFLALIDDHSTDVESALGRIEGPAAAAVGRLLGRTEDLAPGFYPFHGTEDNLATDPGLHLAAPDPVEEMLLFTTSHWLAEPTPEDRRDIARYLGLMFTRAPKMERAIEQTTRAVRAGYEQMVLATAPTMLSQMSIAMDEALADARFIGLRTPEQQTDAFADMAWWLVRASPGEHFVLGDSPVVATLQLGHDEDSWRPLLSEATYVVAMPLSASVALVVATQQLIPVGVESHEFVGAINRLSWRWADRYIVAPATGDLGGVADRMPTETTTSSVEVDVSVEKAFGQGLLSAWKVLDAELSAHSRRCQPLPMPTRRGVHT